MITHPAFELVETYNNILVDGFKIFNIGLRLTEIIRQKFNTKLFTIGIDCFRKAIGIAEQQKIIQAGNKALIQKRKRMHGT